MKHSNYKHIFSEWKTVWILIRWLHQKPADLDLQCFKKNTHIKPGSVGQGFSYEPEYEILVLFESTHIEQNC